MPGLPNAARACCLFAPERLRFPTAVTNPFLGVQNPFQHIRAQPKCGADKEMRVLFSKLTQAPWHDPGSLRVGASPCEGDAPVQLWLPHGRLKHRPVVLGAAVEEPFPLKTGCLITK